MMIKSSWRFWNVWCYKCTVSVHLRHWGLSRVICVIAGAGHILTDTRPAAPHRKMPKIQTDCPHLTGLVYNSHHRRACGSASIRRGKIPTLWVKGEGSSSQLKFPFKKFGYFQNTAEVLKMTNKKSGQVTFTEANKMRYLIFSKLDHNLIPEGLFYWNICNLMSQYVKIYIAFLNIKSVIWIKCLFSATSRKLYFT